MEIKNLIYRVHQNAIEHGWWESQRGFVELIALCHSELSEALEDYRNGRRIDAIYYENDKPSGIPIELADVVIRVFDICGAFNIDLQRAINIKHEYNLKRPYKHGGKVI